MIGAYPSGGSALAEPIRKAMLQRYVDSYAKYLRDWSLHFLNRHLPPECRRDLALARPNRPFDLLACFSHPTETMADHIWMVERLALGTTGGAGANRI